MPSAADRRRISILGCGWLGLPLGRRLAERGHRVRGSTTSPEKLPALRKAGIEAHLLRLAPALQADEADAFFGADVLVLSVPPPRRRNDARAYYRLQINAVAERLGGAPVRHVLFCSSTGVYPDAGGGEVTEEDATPGRVPERAAAGLRETGRALLDAEGLLVEADGFQTTILRLAGLYGPDRAPGRFLAGRTRVSGAGQPVNLLHQADALGLIESVIEQDAWGEIFNACADAHPTRRAFYTAAARALGLDPPVFSDEEGGGGKTVSNRKAKEKLGYAYEHPDPMADL